MNEAIANLEQADRLLNQITVSGHNVMLLAAARQALSAAYNTLKKEAKNETTEGPKQ